MGSGGAIGIGGIRASGGDAGSDGAAGSGGTAGSGGAAGTRAPCDIYQSGNTPCVDDEIHANIVAAGYGR
jgi:hypothetical protein